jgi:hypothetical protein
MKTIELKLDLRGIFFVFGDKITLVYRQGKIRIKEKVTTFK